MGSGAIFFEICRSIIWPSSRSPVILPNRNRWRRPSGRSWPRRKKAVCLVVNNAKVYPPEDLRQATTANCNGASRFNLLCPLIVVREALAGLQTLQGLIVKHCLRHPRDGPGWGGRCRHNGGGSAGWASSSFQEWRDAGVFKVTTICPEPNRWRPVDVRPADGQTPQTLIDPAVRGPVLWQISPSTGVAISSPRSFCGPSGLLEKTGASGA